MCERESSQCVWVYVFFYPLWYFLWCNSLTLSSSLTFLCQLALMFVATSAEWLYGRYCHSVSWSVHRFRPDWQISNNNQWIGSWLWRASDFFCSTIVRLSELSGERLNRMPWNLINTFISPSGWIVLKWNFNVCNTWSNTCWQGYLRYTARRL